MSELTGKQLGPYEILDEIGRGGMATVYRARQPSINRIIAVKVLPRHFLHDPSFIERFKREVDAVSRLEHPHIVPIIDYGEADGMPFIAMRYLASGSLAQLIRRAKVAPSVIERPLTQIAEALDYAHQQGIIHRDLKPGNILLDDNNNAYLTDFGVARVGESNLTGSNIIGTPAYMSPEQASGEHLDGRSDIYSLGVVVYELLAGREPYEAPTPVALLLKHINEPMPSIRAVRPDISPAIEAVILRATAKDPNDRYASAGEMAAAYSAALTGTRSAAPAGDYLSDTDTIIERAGQPTPPPADLDTPTLTPGTTPARTRSPGLVATASAPQPDTVRHDDRRGRVVMLVGVIALLVVALVGGGLFAAQSGLIAGPLPTPTPFINGRIIQTDQFQVTLPQNWTQVRDTVEGERRLITWHDGAGRATVSVALWDIDLDDDDQFDFASAIATYEGRFLAGAADETLIDEATAPDGSLRRSYRTLAGDRTGQIDRFFLNREPFLIVVEFFADDSFGNDLVNTFQLILDSLQVDDN